MEMNLQKLLRFSKKSLKIGIGITSLSYFSIYYKFPELRNNPEQILYGMMRGIRMGNCGIHLLRIYKNPFSSKTDEDKNIEAGKIICKILSKNSGTSIKTGQLLAMMNVLLPEEFTDQLSSLFQQAPVSHINDIKLNIETKLGKNFNEIFSEFNETPIASGSIAQVYSGVLKKSNQKVAVKVIHPFLKDSTNFDLNLMRIFIALGYKIDKNFNFQWFYDDVSKNMKSEIDFRIEADNISKISVLMKNDKQITFPKIIKEYSNEDILMMDFVEGYSITDTDKLKRDKIAPDLVAKILTKAFAKMIFEFGFVHADPHPGNLFIQKTGNNSFKVMLLDNGLYAQLSESTRKNYGAMWKGIITRDEPLLKETATNLGVGFAYKLFVGMVTNQTFENAIESKESNVKTRIKGVLSATDKRKQNQHYGALFRREILECLEKMNRDLVLLFKINNYMESIDSKLGQPINNYWYITKYSFQNYIASFATSWYKKVVVSFQLLSILFWLKVYEFNLRLQS